MSQSNLRLWVNFKRKPRNDKGVFEGARICGPRNSIREYQNGKWVIVVKNLDSSARVALLDRGVILRYGCEGWGDYS